MLLRLTLLALVCLCVRPASAQNAQAIAKQVEDFLIEQTATLGKAKISVTPPPAAERPACTRLVPALGNAQKPWGRLAVQMRCVEGASWSIYVMADVEVEGSWLVLARPVVAGQTIVAEDIAEARGELSAQAPDLITARDQAIGMVARQGMPAGAPLRLARLRAPQAVRAGQMVKLVTQGPGFSASNEGQALNNAAAGQPVRVRLPNGRVVSGTASAEGIVEVRH